MVYQSVFFSLLFFRLDALLVPFFRLFGAGFVVFVGYRLSGALKGAGLFRSSSPSNRGSYTLCFLCVPRKAMIVSYFHFAHHNFHLHMPVPMISPHAFDADCPVGITSSLLIGTIRTAWLRWPCYLLHVKYTPSYQPTVRKQHERGLCWGERDLNN